VNRPGSTLFLNLELKLAFDLQLECHLIGFFLGEVLVYNVGHDFTPL
jgi:hypothetical protein